MSVLAAIRPDSWNFPLFLHVLGAMILVGGILTAASALAFARGEARLLRLGYWSLLGVALPGWVLMRIGAGWIYSKEGWGAGWIYSKEGWDDLPAGVDDPGWLTTGLIIGDASLPILLVSLIVGGVGVYRLRERKGSGLLKATLALSLVLLAAYVVAVWAMAGKPS